jgi:flagellar basal-body rod protein FlgC
MAANLFAIARSGMEVEHDRLETIAQNLANAGTTRTAEGDVYRPMRLVSGPRVSNADDRVSFAARLQTPDLEDSGASGTSFAAGTPFAGVQAYGVEPMDVQPRLVYEPSHPHADANGFVHYPGIDQAAEMTLMVQTLRVYEANTVMFNAARAMYMRALDLGSKG